MKTSDLNQMNKLELKTRLSENLDALQNLRFQQSLIFDFGQDFQ